MPVTALALSILIKGVVWPFNGVGTAS